MQKVLDLMGIPVHPGGVWRLLEFIRRRVREKQKAVILHLNIHGAVLALREPWLKDFLNQVPLVFCDGDGIRWGLRMLGQTPPPKIPITRWIWQLAEFSEKEDFRIFLLGAPKKIVQDAAERLKEKYPRLVIAGLHDGYFQKQGPENENVVSEINRVQPDILLVCFGMPGQEKWILENKEKLNAWIIIPGGGVLDYVAGRLGKAPAWMIGGHLEWLFRIFQEPGRLFKRYITEIPWFFFRVLQEAISRRSRKEPPGLS